MKTQSVRGGVGTVARGGRGRRWGWLLAPLALAACGGEMTLEEPRVEAREPAVSEAAVHDGARLAPRWLRTQGSRGLELSEKMAMDAAGNAITGFTYTGTADASGKPLPSNGRPEDRHMGIVKYRPDGSVAWVRGFAPNPMPDFSPSVWLQAMTVDSRGDVLLGGSASTGASLDGTPVRGTFLAKLDRDTGRVLWARNTRPAPDTEFVFRDFEADAQGNFVALASFYRYVDGAMSSIEMMLIKYRGSDSTPLWDRVWSQPEGYVSATDLAVDPAGNIFVSGGFERKVDFGGEPKLRTTPNPEGWELGAGFILALTPSGTFRWNRQIDGTPWSGVYVTSISVAESRVVIGTTGAPLFQGTDHGHGTFVMGFYVEDGGERWMQRLSSNYGGAFVRAVGEEVVAVATGDASLLGNPRQHPTTEPYMAEYQTFFVSKFWRTSGRYLGSRNVEQVTPNVMDLRADSIAMSPVDGEVVVSGLYGGETDFGTGATVTPRGSIDTFLLRLKH